MSCTDKMVLQLGQGEQGVDAADWKSRGGHTVAGQSAAGRSGRQSDWAANDVFGSDSEGEGDGGSRPGARSTAGTVLCPFLDDNSTWLAMSYRLLQISLLQVAVCGSCTCDGTCCIHLLHQ